MTSNLLRYHKCNINGNGGQSEDNSQLLLNKKLAVKDNIFIGKVPLMNGSKTLEGFVPEHDATVVERILNNGGTIAGNVTCENLCLSGASYNTTYGPVKNPWNPDFSAGGSSSGTTLFSFCYVIISNFQFYFQKRFQVVVSWYDFVECSSNLVNESMKRYF